MSTLSRRRARSHAPDEGAGTVLLLAVVGVLLLVAAGSAVLAQVTAARHRAALAADLAALAAADVVLGREAGDACGRAAETAAVNGARLRGCGLAAGRSVLVEVVVTPRGAAAVLGDAVQRARAGPRAGEP